MNTASDTDASQARCADADRLAALLSDARSHTLATFAAYERTLGAVDLSVPYSPQVNPPRWELGHVGWFQEWWLRRNPQRALGVAADPHVRRPAPRLLADTSFDSSRVPHVERWRLALPTTAALREELSRGLDDTLALLREARANDDALYFFRLCLFHEDMHHEAAVYMAQHLGVALEGWAAQAHTATQELAIEGGEHASGAAQTGFMFDNELGAHRVQLAPFRIDAAPVSWERYLSFVAAGGYERAAGWSPEGWAWLQSERLRAPRYLRPSGSTWQRLSFGRWIDLDLAEPAMNLSCFEAEAYCAWAGRRLPTEAEWEFAAQRAGATFEWGQVWEWTASPFEPYPGFTPHPYREYSAPWFTSRRVLRGGSFATQPRMKHRRYRNFFPPERNDIFAGFRTCAQ